MDSQLTGMSALAGGGLAPTKSNAALLGNYFAQQVKDGFRKPLETIASLRAAKLAIDTALAAIEPDAHDEIRTYGRTGADVQGAKLEIVEAGVKYDYSQDPAWEGLKVQVDQAQAALKEREKYLKALSGPKSDLDDVTGEVYTSYPPIKTSSTTVKVTLAQ